MKATKEYFPYVYHTGDFEIVDGSILIPETKCRFFLIEGSALNDGVHSASEELEDETFHGYVTELAPPRDFLELVEEIEEWCEKNGEASMKPYTSESFDDYSYTLAKNASGNNASWKDVFSSRLKQWRKL